jgi:dimethylargininase
MLTAITRPPTEAIARCELTYLAREPIDAALALRQHEAYAAYLRELGIHVIELLAEPDLPDATFVEDAALVLDELAVITLPGATSRRPEVASVAAALEPYRPLRFLEPLATLDGGDVLRAGRTLYVGAGGRSNDAGVAQLAAILVPYGYSVRAVSFTGCLHLKTAVTALADDVLLANPAWVDVTQFAGCRSLAVPPNEPHAANSLTFAGVTLLPAGFPGTHSLLAAHGFTVRTLDISELQKAEAGVTCSSLIFDDHERIRL